MNLDEILKWRIYFLTNEIYKAIKEIELLTPEEEKTASYETLFYHNLRLVLSIAYEYRNASSVPFDDLFQSGCEGLAYAAKGYNKQNRFSTYATFWIKKYILRELNKDHIQSVPLNISEDAASIKIARSRLFGSLGVEPTPEDISLDTSIPIKRVRAALAATQATISLEAPIGEDEDGCFGDTISSTFSTPYEKIAYEDDKETLRQVLSTLTPKEAEIINLRFGLDGPAKTLEEAGAAFGLSKERARQIQNSAIRKLRAPLRKRILAECFN